MKDMEVKKELEQQDSIIKFCEECSNMLVPAFDDQMLMFKCIKPGCAFRMRVIGGGQRQNLVSRRDFLDQKNIIVRPEFALDPARPRESIACPECGHTEAVYMVTTDMEDTKLVLIYICTNAACGHNWRKTQAQLA